MLLFENHSFIFCFGCTASSLPPGLSLVQQVWAALHYIVEASSGGFSSCRAQAFELAGFSSASAQQLWHTGLVAPQHMESSQTRD